MSLEDFDLPPRVLHARDKDAAQPEWQRMALRQREADRAAKKKAADELADIESVESEEARWSAIFRAQAADTVLEQVIYPNIGVADRRVHGGDAA